MPERVSVLGVEADGDGVHYAVDLGSEKNIAISSEDTYSSYIFTM